MPSHLIVRLLYTGEKTRTYPWEDTRRTPDCHTFYWISAGEGRLETEAERFEMKRGMLFYLPPGLRLRLFSAPARPMRIAMALFDAAEVAHANRRWGAVEPVGALPLPFAQTFDGFEKKEMDGVFRELEREWTPGSARSERETGIRLVRLIAALAEREATPSGRGIEELVRRVAERLEADYASPLRVDELAAGSGVSASYLRKRFVERYGLSPKAYLQRLRMEHAVRRLMHTNASVKEIARECGFADELHFSKAFKKYCGSSPATYRKELRAGN